MPPSAVQRVMIVGGGTAGWMAAACLRRRTQLQVTVVESPEVGTIGVGEATIPALVEWLENMKIDEDDFMRHCHATYKLGIQFINWTRDSFSYWHPFGLCGGLIGGLDLFHYWLRRSLDGDPHVGSYSSYSMQTLLCESGKAHRPVSGRSVIANYAFHLDATEFARYLQQLATAEGVIHRRDTIRDVALNERGHISHLVSTSGERLDADLYVDCTGFRGLLIEQALGDPHIDWSSQLLCDRAVTLRLPPDDRTPPFTRSTALKAGWVWRIPLSNRTGCGYVYSSSHATDDQAAAELLHYADQPQEFAADLRTLRMRVGRRTEFWKANCVSIGLSSGFIEPLESTGIFLIQRALDELVECFPDDSFSGALMALYNRRMADVYEQVRDFVLLHYLLNGRTEPFWADSRRVDVPDSLAQRLALYDEAGMLVEADRHPVFRETNYFHVLLGGERMPKRPLPRAAFCNMRGVRSLMEKMKRDQRTLADRLPAHCDLMVWLHSGRSTAES